MTKATPQAVLVAIADALTHLGVPHDATWAADVDLNAPRYIVEVRTSHPAQVCLTPLDDEDRAEKTYERDVTPLDGADVVAILDPAWRRLRRLRVRTFYEMDPNAVTL